MSNLRFNQVFAALMLLSFFSAFVIPPRYTNPGRGELAGLFSPVSRPTSFIAGRIYSHFHRDVPVDVVSPSAPRTPDTILEENRRLWIDYSSLTVKFEKLSQLNADRDLVGDIRPLCKPAAVTGTDSSGLRESLILSGPLLSGFKNDMPVLFAGGLVGRITRAGFGGAQVRLLTDRGFVVLGRIGQYKIDTDGKTTLEWIEHLHPRIQGAGNGVMAIRGDISMQQVRDLNIAVNDMVVLDDRDWPANIQGYWVGKITSVQPQTNSPLVADIRVEPSTDLLRLHEVMVLVKGN